MCNSVGVTENEEARGVDGRGGLMLEEDCAVWESRAGVFGNPPEVDVAAQEVPTWSSTRGALGTSPDTGMSTGTRPVAMNSTTTFFAI